MCSEQFHVRRTILKSKQNFTDPITAFSFETYPSLASYHAKFHMYTHYQKDKELPFRNKVCCSNRVTAPQTDARSERRAKVPCKRFIRESEVPQSSVTMEEAQKPPFSSYSDSSNSIPSPASIRALYTNGFHVYPNFARIPDDLVQRLKKHSHHSVLFNDGCPKRLMHVFSPELIAELDICGQVETFVQMINPHVEADTWADLWSLPGNKKQPAHFDFDPKKVVGLINNLMPLLAVVALEDHSSLDVWVGYKGLLDRSITSPIAPTTINLNKGDVLIFLGDCIHAGSAYNNNNVRLHCYFPASMSGVPHPDNKTNIVYRL